MFRRMTTVLLSLLLIPCATTIVQCETIHDAVTKDNIATVRKLLKVNPKLVFAKDKTKSTPLHLAALKNRLEIARLLIAKGANTNAKEKEGVTPLHVAAFGDHVEIVRLLISSGAKVDSKDNYGQTPLFVAASGKAKRSADFLITHGADVNAKNKNGSYPLCTAIVSNATDVVALLLAKGADANEGKSVDDITPLHLATLTGNVGIVKHLLANKADVNAKIRNGPTHLHFAAIKGRKEIAELLIENGANVDALYNNPDVPLFDGMTESAFECKAIGYQNFKLTPLYCATIMGQKQMVELLIAKGADVNAKASDDSTPLHASAFNIYYYDIKPTILRMTRSAPSGNHSLQKNTSSETPYGAIAKLLIEHGANVDAKDYMGRTPLLLAAGRGQKDVAELLIVKGADINANDDKGNTPINSAALFGLEDMVKLLIDSGANVNAIDKEDSTPLSIAVKYGDKAIETLLRQHGANK